VFTSGKIHSPADIIPLANDVVYYGSDVCDSWAMQLFYVETHHLRAFHKGNVLGLQVGGMIACVEDEV
jgi:hypothetical protein